MAEKFEERVKEMTENLEGWNVSLYSQHRNFPYESKEIVAEFESRTAAGQDLCVCAVFDDENDNEANMQSLVKELHDYWEDFDVDEETYLWIGEDGHGKNGAPYHIKDILEDMTKAKQMIKEMVDYFASKFEEEFGYDATAKHLIAVY